VREKKGQRLISDRTCVERSCSYGRSLAEYSDVPDAAVWINQLLQSGRSHRESPNLTQIRASLSQVGQIGNLCLGD